MTRKKDESILENTMNIEFWYVDLCSLSINTKKLYVMSEKLSKKSFINL